MKKKISTKTVWAKFLCLCKRTPPTTYAVNGGKFSELISKQITSNFNNNSDQQKEIIGPKVSDRKSEWNNKIRTMTSLSNVRDPHRPSTIPVTSHVTRYITLNDELENVQKRAARFVTRNYSYETGSMTGILEELKWETLQKRREDHITVQRSKR